MSKKTASPTGKTLRSAREVALELLLRVEEQGAYSNLLLNQLLTRHPLSRPDAALATALAYGTIQRLNTIDYFLNRFVAKGVAKLEPWVRVLLRLGFYQLYYLDRVPDHAAVSESVHIAKRRGHAGIAGLVNGVLRNVIRERNSLQIPDSLPVAQRLALVHSHPEWLTARWLRRYGESAAAALCAANNEPPRISARASLLRGGRGPLLDKLQAAGIQAEPSQVAPDGIVFGDDFGNAAKSEWYAAGELTVQDESSMLVARLLSPEPGDRVLDCCAAPGGKTTHIAELMGDRGEIVAGDVHPHKERLVAEQAERLGLRSVQTIVADARELDSRFPAGSFDRVLLDAPCSGLGVIRRKPDLKWTKSEADIAAIAELQLSLLRVAGMLVKPGGTLVYSTCTTEPEENEAVVGAFLQELADFMPDPELDRYLPQPILEAAGHKPGSGYVQLLPHHFHTDGFFMARLTRRPLSK